MAHSEKLSPRALSTSQKRQVLLKLASYVSQSVVNTNY